MLCLVVMGEFVDAHHFRLGKREVLFDLADTETVGDDGFPKDQSLFKALVSIILKITIKAACS